MVAELEGVDAYLRADRHPLREALAELLAEIEDMEALPNAANRRAYRLALNRARKVLDVEAEFDRTVREG